MARRDTYQRPHFRLDTRHISLDCACGATTAADEIVECACGAQFCDYCLRANHQYLGELMDAVQACAECVVGTAISEIHKLREELRNAKR